MSADESFAGLEAGIWGDTDAEHVQCSMAISMKRIADALETLAGATVDRIKDAADLEHLRETIRINHGLDNLPDVGPRA